MPIGDFFGHARTRIQRLRYHGLSVQGINRRFIGGRQRELIREFFGAGMKGVQHRREDFQIPVGLSRKTLEAYREIARRAIEEGIDTAGVQAGRLELIERALRQRQER